MHVKLNLDFSNLQWKRKLVPKVGESEKLDSCVWLRKDTSLGSSYPEVREIDQGTEREKHHTYLARDTD